MTKKSSAEYQRRYRQRLREQGLVKKEVWILPDNSKQLQIYEKTLRTAGSDLDLPTTDGDTPMSENNSNRWNIDSLFSALNERPAFRNGSCSIEIIEGVESSIVISMHDYGDLPIFISIGGEQILVESVLFSLEDVENPHKFNAYVLRTHKYLPLSTISLETDIENGDYYHMFGALSASSSISTIVQEIETLAENVIQATEAFSAFLKS